MSTRGRPFASAPVAAACLVVGVLMASVAMAAGGGETHHGINWWGINREQPPVGWAIVNFVLFVSALVYLLRQPAANTFARRHASIKQSLEAAQSALAKAKAHREEYSTKLSRVDTERTALIEGGRRDGEEAYARILEEAKAYAARLRTDSETVTQLELRSAKARLQRETARAAMVEAERIIKAQLTPDDHQRLIIRSIEALEAESAPVSLAGQVAHAQGDAA